jgi:hypothetical protein
LTLKKSTYMDWMSHDVKRHLNDFELYEKVWYECKSKHLKSYIQIETSIGT